MLAAGGASRLTPISVQRVAGRHLAGGGFRSGSIAEFQHDGGSRFRKLLGLTPMIRHPTVH
jgi:hypothetical protein